MLNKVSAVLALMLLVCATTVGASTTVSNDSGGCWTWGNAWNGEGVWFNHNNGSGWARGVIVNRDYLPSWFCAGSDIEYGSALASIVPTIYGFRVTFNSTPTPAPLESQFPGAIITGPYPDGSWTVSPVDPHTGIPGTFGSINIAPGYEWNYNDPFGGGFPFGEPSGTVVSPGIVDSVLGGDFSLGGADTDFSDPGWH